MIFASIYIEVGGEKKKVMKIGPINTVKFVCPTKSFSGGKDEFIRQEIGANQQSVISIEARDDILIEIENDIVEVFLKTVKGMALARFTSNRLNLSGYLNSMIEIGNENYTIHFTAR